METVAVTFNGGLPPALIGLAAILILLVTYWIVSGPAGYNPLGVVVGADGRPSTSKLQFLLWTLVAIFSYASIFAARIGQQNYKAIDTIPNNLLIAMGLSGLTMVTAKAITSSYVSSGKLNKTPPAPGGPASGFAAIFQDDAGFPDLSKIQVMAWTGIAIVVYIMRVLNELGINNPVLPDIDTALMVLMGLGQGSYLGKKLTTTSDSTTSVATGTFRRR